MRWRRCARRPKLHCRPKTAAEEEAREAKRKMAPISVFISRATQRLYVRQALQPLFESEVTIADPDEPLGTYVFTALAYANDETDLRWNAASHVRRLPLPQPVAWARASTRPERRRQERARPT